MYLIYKKRKRFFKNKKKIEIPFKYDGLNDL